MTEYKVITTNVKTMEEELNLLARDGWRVASTTAVSGCSITINGTPVIITLERETSL